MANAQIPEVQLTSPTRKSYFPFKFGLRSQPDQGVGALKAVNAKMNTDGHAEKTKGISFVKELLGVSQISHMFEFQKSDGNIQIVVIYKVGLFYVARTIEADNTIGYPVGPEENLTGVITFVNGSDDVSATGAAFLTELAVGDWVYADGEESNIAQVKTITDNNNLVLEENYDGDGTSTNGRRASVHFTGAQFDNDKIGGITFVSNNSTTTGLYRFNGTLLEKTTNVSDPVLSIATDSNRLALCFKDRVEFTGDNIADSNDAKSGTGINKFGIYGTSIAYPKAVCKGGDGIIIFGAVGSEAHQVYPNAASDDVSSKTKVPSYTNKGLGITRPSQCVSGKFFIYNANKDGVHELNPYSGESKNLTEMGAIRDIWKSLKKDRVLMGYDPSTDYVVAVAQRLGQNDTAVCFDLSQKQRACWTSENQYYTCLATINGKLHGGSSRDGKIYKLFSGSTDFGGNQQTFRHRTELDGLGGVPFLKTFRKFVVYSELHPRSSFIARVFLDDDTIPIFERSFGTKNASNKGGTNAAYGMYEFRMGKVTAEELSNNIRLSQKNARFNRISIEIIERSARAFKLKDIIIEYKSRGRFVRKFLSKDI